MGSDMPAWACAWGSASDRGGGRGDGGGQAAVARSRISATLAGLERDAGAIKLGRRATIQSEMFDVERELADITTDLQAIQIASGAPTPEKNEGPEEVSYMIVRKGASGASTIAARDVDSLRAGDVLRVGVGPQQQ